MKPKVLSMQDAQFMQKKNIKKFSKIQSNNIIALRPAMGGISVADWNDVVGKKVKKEIKEGNIIKKNFLI